MYIVPWLRQDAPCVQNFSQMKFLDTLPNHCKFNLMYDTNSFDFATKRSKSTQVHHFYKFVDIESMLLHAKFHDHQTSGLKKTIFKGYYHIWEWRPSWSCDLDHLYKFSFPLSQGGFDGQAVS